MPDDRAVIPYATPLVDRRPIVTLPRLATAGLVVACASIVFNVSSGYVAIDDYRDVHRTLWGRDPARRVAKVVARGRPNVFPSRTWFQLFLVEATLSTALALMLAHGTGACLRSKDPDAGLATLDRFAKWKLLTFWLGVLVAAGYGRNLSRVRTEFEFLGDLGYFHSARYIITSLVAALCGCVFPILYLRFRWRTRRQSQPLPDEPARVDTAL
jgi:hypothetical protein